MIKPPLGKCPFGWGRKAFVVALLGAVVVLLGVGFRGGARGQQVKDEGARGRFPGHVFVWADGGQVAGVLSVDPNSDLWTRVSQLASWSSRVSPDGTKMICPPILPPRNASLSTYIVPLAEDGEPIRVDVPAVPGLNYVTWSPDGRHVLVSVSAAASEYAKFETWRFAADGTGKTRLPIPSTECVLDWSRDGKWLLTQSARAPWNTADIRSVMKRPCYLMRPDGSDERLVVPAPETEGLPADVRLTRGHRFAPDGRSLVYLEGFDVQVDGRMILCLRLCVISVDGKDRRVVRDGSARARPMTAAWSPDGNWLAVCIHELKPGADLKTPRIGDSVPRIELLDKTGSTRKTLVLLPSPMEQVVDWR
jgi:WD40 repeat protein